MRNLANAIIVNRSIKTTLPKAKELRPKIEKLVALAVRKSKQSAWINAKGEAPKLNAEGVALRRLLFNRLRSRESVRLLCDEIVDLIGERKGGYTRIVKAGFRTGDAAPMAIIEFVDKEGEATVSETKADAKAEETNKPETNS